MVADTFNRLPDPCHAPHRCNMSSHPSTPPPPHPPRHCPYSSPFCPPAPPQKNTRPPNTPPPQKPPTHLALVPADIAQHQVLRLGVLLQILNSIQRLGLCVYVCVGGGQGDRRGRGLRGGRVGRKPAWGCCSWGRCCFRSVDAASKLLGLLAAIPEGLQQATATGAAAAAARQ